MHSACGLTREVSVKSVLLLAAVAVCASAQNSASLTGRVLDPSGSPVPNARVSLTERDTHVRLTVRTEPTGEYRFPFLRVTDYLLEAQAEGFGASETRSLRVDKPLTTDLTLELARLTSQVQVTAATIAQTVDEQSKALDIIDSAELERRNEFSVAEALRTIPGVRVHQLGGPGSFTRIAMRGMRATDTSILIDGFRLRDAASPQGDATAFVGDLLLSNTERIEVLRGSGSSLYGTHATAGVINVITDQGGGRLRGDLTAEGGGLGLARTAAKFSGGAWQDRVRFAGGLMHLNVSRGIDDHDHSRNTTGHGFVQFQLAPATVVSARLLAADTFTQLNDSPFLANGRVVPSPDDPDARRAGFSTNTLLALSHHWSPRASMRVNYSGVSTRRDNRDGSAGTRFEPMFNESNRFDGRIDTVQARADLQPDRRHLLTAGYEFERETFDNRSSTEHPDPASRVNARLGIQQSSHAAFAQAQGRYFAERLQLLASGRIQSFNLTQPEFSTNNPLYRQFALPSPPRARTGDFSAAYSFVSTGTKIRAHVGNSYRAPALYERFGAAFFAGAFSAYGDPALAPERLVAFDGGVDQYLAASRIRVSATYFYTRVQQSIIFDGLGIVGSTDPWGRFGGYRNSGGGLARGAELSIEANPIRSMTLRGSYTRTNADDRTSQFNNGSLRTIRVSDHMFTAVASQRLWRRLDVTLDFTGASNYAVPFSRQYVEFEGMRKLDLSAAWTQPVSDSQSLRFYTRVENMMNRTYLEEGFRTPGAWAVAGVKWMF